jgi:nitroreductase
VEFLQVVRRRRMVRAYDGRAVDPTALDRVLDSARRAASAGNTQAVSFVVVRDPAVRAAVAEVCGEPAAVARGLPRWVSTAPVLVVPCLRPADYDERYAAVDKRASRGPRAWDVPWPWVDAGQSLALLLCAAVDQGLAAGLLDVADRDALRGALGVPAEVVPLGVVTVGHPAPDRPSSSLARGRKPLGDLVHADRWGTGWDTMERYEFAFDPRFRPFLRVWGATPDNSEVRIADGELRARFGFAHLTTPLANITATERTGPYQWYRAIGARLSLADRGLIYGTNCAGGLCIRFAEPVPGGLGPLRHPGLTVTVAEPERLAEALSRSR